MALNFKLGDKRDITPDTDPMHRSWVGYDTHLTDEDLWAANRGMWILGPRAQRESYVTFSYDGKVVLVAEIDDIETLPWPDPNDPRGRAKQAIIGRVLTSGEVYEHFIGRQVNAAGRNPVSYQPDPGDATPACRCGCGQKPGPGRAFIAGHDQRAAHQRIMERWGSVEKFVDWYDATYAEQADPAAAAAA